LLGRRTIVFTVLAPLVSLLALVLHTVSNHGHEGGAHETLGLVLADEQQVLPTELQCRDQLALLLAVVVGPGGGVRGHRVKSAVAGPIVVGPGSVVDGLGRVPRPRQRAVGDDPRIDVDSGQATVPGLATVHGQDQNASCVVPLYLHAGDGQGLCRR
jgi:hypothetical protein